MGKGNEGDNLTGFTDDLANPATPDLAKFFNQPDLDETQARTWLGNATARHIYYFGEVIDNSKPVWAENPACACGIVREQHVSQIPLNEQSPLQAAFEYSDGMGSVVVKKMQAEPEQESGPLRWVASGKTILNNKGKPVKQYEPYFSPPEGGHRFEEPVEVGVTPVIYYDAVGRVIRTELPDGSFSRVEFSPWHVQTFDQNDTVKESKWYTDRNPPDPDQPLPSNPVTGELLVTPKQRAAWLAAQHYGTPSLTILDSLGREVVSIAHNRMGAANALVDEKYITFTRLDAEGKPLWVQDPRRNRVMQYIMPPLPDGVHPFNDASNLKAQGFAPCYDIAGNLLFQHSMDAGDRWMLNDAAGKPMLAWNSRKFITRVTYDGLHRATGSFVTGADLVHPAREIQFEKLVYGEGQVDDKQRNLRGKLYEHSDTAGVVTSEAYDFKGNPLRTTRQLMVDYKATPDWSQNPAREAELFAANARYDALNRPVQIIAAHSTAANPQRINITQPAYNEAGLLVRVDVWLNQSAEPTTLLAGGTASQHVVKNLNYNAKGQRVLLQYGNGSETSYDYEPETFQLKRLKTTRNSNSAVLQELNYTYDPVGNITQIVDNANDRVYHSNACVLPGAEYRYDALYRLIAASGREHKGDSQQNDWDDSSHYVPTLPNDCQALQNYVETYRYDEVSNIMQMVHQEGHNLEQPGQVIWNRRYQYALDSNHLLATSLPGDPANLPGYVATPGYSAKYTYDSHGNIMAMPHLPQMSWDFIDQLSTTTGMAKNDNPPPDKVPAMTYYVYDAIGQRVSKITEMQNGARKDERIYLGGFELYRKYNSNGQTVALERETLHIMDDKQRITLVETKTRENGAVITAPTPLTRYQHGNHLGSARLELDEAGAIISYEEYYPYGSTSYQAVNSQIQVSLKRYRYTGKERDEESGLYYHGVRYYISWLGRWTSCDTALDDTSNLYTYAKSNPVKFMDPDGRRPATRDEAADLQRLQQIESDARERYSKLSTVRKVWSHLVGGPQIEAGRAKYNREAYAAAINRAAEGEGIAITPGLVRGVFTFMTDREAYMVRQLEILQAITNSALASATYTTADIAGARPEVKEGLTLAASALSDIASVAVQTKTHRDVNSGWGNYQFGPQPEMVRGAPLEPIGGSGQTRDAQDPPVAIARPSLRTLAIQADVRDVIEDGPFEVFAHGTTSIPAQEYVETQGKNLSTSGGNFRGKFYTVPDVEVARKFAARAATRVTGQQSAVVGIALPRAVADQLRANKMLTPGPVENPPPGVSSSAQQWVFQPGALDTLKKEGFFFYVQ